MKIYLAGSFAYDNPQTTAQRKAEIEQVAKILQQKGFDVYTPHQFFVENAWSLSLEEWAQKVFDADVEQLNNCDIVVLLSYGKINNSGCIWECGYCYAKGIKVVVVRMTNTTESLMVLGGAHAVLNGVDGLETYDFATMPKIKCVVTSQS